MRYLIILLFLSCSPHHLTESQLSNNTPEAGTFDTLAAYRKMPGQPKDVNVKGYVRKDGDSVRAYKRSRPANNSLTN